MLKDSVSAPEGAVSDTSLFKTAIGARAIWKQWQRCQQTRKV